MSGRKRMLHVRPGRVTSLLGGLLMLGVVGNAVAYTVYKSEDAAGNITYSTHPPPNALRVEPVKLQTGPSAEQQAEAARREQAIVEAADQIRQENEAAAAQRAASIHTAQSKLSAAEKNLEEVSVYRDDDWQGTVSGYRRLKQSYFDRVAQARSEVEQAKVELKAARRRAQQ